MNPIVDIFNLSVHYRKYLALNSVCLKIYEGEFVAIAGPNGAGKTTLLDVISGFKRPSEGKVKVFGFSTTDYVFREARKKIGYVPQIINIDPRMPMKVKDVIMLGMIAKKRFFKKFSLKNIETFDEVIKLVGIKDLLKRPVGHLSGGEQKKVMIALALIRQPRLLILDEPIANLDINAQANILELVDRIHTEQGLTTIVVMHNLEFLPKSCSRMVLLKDGRVTFDGTLLEALSEEVISRVYECQIKIIKNDEGIFLRVKR